MSANKNKVKLTYLNRRGKNIQIKFSITSMECEESILTDTIPIWDMCLVRFKFVLADSDHNYCKLLNKISYKKHENAKKALIAIQFSQADFEKQCIVGENWTNFTTMGSGIQTNDSCFGNDDVHIHDLFMDIEVNVKVYYITAGPLLVNQRLYEDATFTDFNLKGEDGMVAVHKSVLSTQSDVFLAMLNREWNETTEGTLSMNGGSVTMQTLQAFKDYMYLQTLPDDLNLLQNLLQIASCYMIDNLKAECITKVVDLVTPKNFDSVVEFACLNNLPNLMKAVVTDIPEKVVKGIQEKNDDKKVSTDEPS